MTKMKTLARFAVAAILATGVFAGSSGSAEARDWHHRSKPPISTGTDDGTTVDDGGATTLRTDTGWG